MRRAHCSRLRARARSLKAASTGAPIRRTRRYSTRCSVAMASLLAQSTDRVRSASMPTARCSRWVAAASRFRTSMATRTIRATTRTAIPTTSVRSTTCSCRSSRKQISGSARYDMVPEVAEMYARLSFTTYNSDQQLAATPVTCAGTALGCSVPVTNTALPADLRTLSGLARHAARQLRLHQAHHRCRRARPGKQLRRHAGHPRLPWHAAERLALGRVWKLGPAGKGVSAAGRQRLAAAPAGRDSTTPRFMPRRAARCSIHLVKAT